MMNLSVRAENRLGYYDQIINLDTTVPYAQVANADGAGTLSARYPIVAMNLIRSESTIYTEGSDFALVSGNVVWSITPPSKSTVLGLHYLTYPHWRVIEHPHVTRATLRKYKTKSPTTPAGDPVDLPVQAICKYEWLL